MSGPTSYIVETDGLYIAASKGSEKFQLPYSPDELMETIEERESINYILDIVSVDLVKNSELNSFFETIYADIDAVYGDGNKKIKSIITEFCNPHRVTAEATFEEGDVYINCGVTVKIGELEFGPFLFLHEKIQGGGSDAAQDENVDLPETD